MCLAEREQPCHGVDAATKAFIDSITPFKKLDARQQAAVVAMEGRFAYDDGA